MFIKRINNNNNKLKNRKICLPENVLFELTIKLEHAV